MSRRKLGEILVEGGVPEAAVNAGLAAQKGRLEGRRIGQILVDRGDADAERVARALAKQLGIPYVDPTVQTVDPEVLWRLPRNVAEKHRAFAYARVNRGVKVAMADPRDGAAVMELEFLLKLSVYPEASSEARITQAISRHYDMEPIAHRMLEGVPRSLRAPTLSPNSLELDPEAFKSRLGAGQSGYVEILNFLLINAIERGASDIHMEPQPNGVRIRFRIDGLLREVLVLPAWALVPLVSRVKVVARLDVAEHRRAQDGKARAEIGNRHVDLRVSIVPSQFGESVVIRVLDSRTLRVDLGELGWNPRALQGYFHMVSQPQGMVLVVGPTGSGKTTTLYATINRIRNETTSIVTIEDPIEHTLPGIAQVQVDEKTGMTFATAIRSLLRQDPNVMVVGEIRDPQSAQAAGDAATTGHLVLSTMHTNSAVAAVTRFRDLEVPAYLVGHSLLGVVAQRLLRRVCTSCSIVEPPDELDWERLQLPPEDLGPETRRVGPGCPACQYAGYSGRLGVFEILRVDDGFRQLVLKEVDESALWAYVREHGFVTMFEDALDKVRRGLTTLEEVARTVPVDTWRERTRRRGGYEAAPLVEPGEVPIEALEEIGGDAIQLVELPAEVGMPAPMPNVAPTPAPRAGARAKVLVVDDTQEILQLVTVTLEDDYDVVVAHDGVEALEQVAATQPDVVVLDVMMPRLSGYEVCRRLKSEAATEALPVLILSARGDSAHVKQGFQVGADDYLPKPFDPEELELRIRALLRRSGRLPR